MFSPKTLFLPLVLLSVACGGTPEAARPWPLPSIDDCTSGWQQLTEYRVLSAPKALRYHENELYYFYSGATTTGGWVRIDAQPVAGGAARTLVENVNATDVWIEGDQVFYGWAGGLWQVPTTGGDPIAIIPEQPDYRDIVGHALSANALAWWKLYATDGGTEIWLTPRDGTTTPKLLGTVPQVNSAVFTSDALITAGVGMDSNDVTFLDGSGQRVLQYAGHWNIGLDTSGVYGWQETGTDSGIVQLAPIDGGPVQRFWPSMPPTVTPYQLWPDSYGGWLISAMERFADGQSHPSIFFMDAAGNATRAACSTGFALYHAVNNEPAFAADAVYVTDVDESTFSWRIVKIARP